ncbi:MAG: HEAT repeat domain-containing protein [Acidobacteriota bacterium]
MGTILKLISGLLVENLPAGARALWIRSVLSRCGGAAVPALVERASDADATVRQHALARLRTLGSRSMEGLHVITRAAQRDADDHVRRMALETIGAIGAAARSSVPVLCELLRDKNPAVRRRVAIALGKIGHGAKDALPHLKRLAGDANKHVVSEALRARELIGL